MPSPIIASGVYTMSPTEWQQVLEDSRYTGQRRLSEPKLAWLARLDAQGHFREGEMLTFAQHDGSLHLVDGQHRLTAGARRKMPSEFYCRVIPAESMDDVGDIYCQFDQIDTGQSRHVSTLVPSLPAWVQNVGTVGDVGYFWRGIGDIAKRPGFHGPAATHFDKVDVLGRFESELRALAATKAATSNQLIWRGLISAPTLDACLAVLADPKGKEFLESVLSAEGSEIGKALGHSYLTAEIVHDPTRKGVAKFPVTQRRRRRCLVAWNVFRGEHQFPPSHGFSEGLSAACFKRNKGIANALQPYESPNGLVVSV